MERILYNKVNSNQSSNLAFLFYSLSGIRSYQSDFSETDGDDDDENLVERNGVLYPHKSWFFVFHSTIKG